MTIAEIAPRRLPFAEFIGLLALLFATVAFSIDAMLPVLGQIGEELSPPDPGRAQLVITVFVVGLGLGTFLSGPISDRFGRKPVILTGIAVYMAAASLAAVSESLEVLLAARFVQGLGAAAPRVVAQALVRDLYAGRHMARVMSFAMAVFVLVPAVAPLIGSWIAAGFGWRAIFWSFLVFGLVSGSWLALRQPETLPPESRRPLHPADLWAALREVLAIVRVRLYLLALAFSFAPMFAWLASVALVFDETYGRGAEFPYWFALIAVLSAPASLINAALVLRLGMQRLVSVALAAQALSAVGFLVLMQAGGADFPAFVAFMWLQFFSIGLIFGNLNALALEPLGHVAGMATSVMGGISTMAAAIIATPIARAFDGTGGPLAVGALLCSALALACVRLAARWRT
jgi:MFS transporter, DHA1 family, multidrug resistance protein